ncbi:hypothetical protein FB567DRAFT_626110 [Paraphoma chrysanthemicola]|uniref:F-box domain-containing protein n=1 Tax=Paraphoma chrysanthemicola TaxID=798071 RepID=A0A8K0RCM9_9PLEO|nr:hypothetical protein FB567DRAFT_626110 [Paraphoma chrysanthemicola]
MTSPMVSLLDMPNELLVNIVQHVDAGGIKSLSSASQHLRSIAQGFLINIAVLSPSKIWKLVDTLVARPEFANDFTKVQLGSMSQETQEETNRYGKERIAALTVVNKNTYRRILRRAFGAGEHSRILRVGTLFKDNPASIGFVTIPLLSNTFVDTDADDSPELPELHRFLQSHFQNRIENVTIFHEEVIIEYEAGPVSKSPTRYYERAPLDIQTFHNLKHLAISLWILTPFLPHHTLPQSLVSLHIVLTSKWVGLDVELVDDLMTNARYFSNLALVKLVFQKSFWQTARLFASNPRMSPDVVPALDRWSESRVDLEMLYNCGLRKLASEPDVLARAIERCRDESMKDLFKDPEIFAEFGILKAQ